MARSRTWTSWLTPTLFHMPRAALTQFTVRRCSSTLNGHRRLFERAGFLIERIGPAVGPIFALRDLAGQTLRHGFPSALGRWLYGAWLLATLPMLALDRRLGEGEAGRCVASLTYLLARKA
jgi:hypothetical protein